jgi:hypothetical protein
MASAVGGQCTALNLSDEKRCQEPATSINGLFCAFHSRQVQGHSDRPCSVSIATDSLSKVSIEDTRDEMRTSTDFPHPLPNTSQARKLLLPTSSLPILIPKKCARKFTTIYSASSSCSRESSVLENSTTSTFSL